MSKPAIGLEPEAMFRLRQFGGRVLDAFGHPAYLVGSSMRGPGWGDVDVRLHLPDKEFAALVGEPVEPQRLNPRWYALCTAFSELGTQMTKLPIDFSIEQMSAARYLHGPQVQEMYVEGFAPGFGLRLVPPDYGKRLEDFPTPPGVRDAIAPAFKALEDRGQVPNTGRQAARIIGGTFCWSWRLIQFLPPNEPAFLVHGSVHGRSRDTAKWFGRLPWAWVEYRGEVLITSDGKICPDSHELSRAFYELQPAPQVEARYTASEALELGLSTGSFGPYHKRPEELVTELMTSQRDALFSGQQLTLTPRTR